MAGTEAGVTVAGASPCVRIPFHTGHDAFECRHPERIDTFHSIPDGIHNGQIGRQSGFTVGPDPFINGLRILCVGPEYPVRMIPGDLNHAIKVVSIQNVPGNMPPEKLVSPAAAYIPVNLSECFFPVQEHHDRVLSPGKPDI